MREWLWSSDTQWYVWFVLFKLHFRDLNFYTYLRCLITFLFFPWIAALGGSAGAVCEVSWACWALWGDGRGVQTGNSHLRTGERLSGEWMFASHIWNDQPKELAIMQKVFVVELGLRCGIKTRGSYGLLPQPISNCRRLAIHWNVQKVCFTVRL